MAISLTFLVVIHVHDSDFAGNHPSIQRRRLDVTITITYDRLNYARYLPYYYAQMSQLPTSSPDVHTEFMQGGFLFQLGSNHPFGRIPVDQTIEETVNNDTQMPGGPRGSVWNQGL